MQTTSDEVLIERIARGDRLAMQVRYARHHVRLYRFVLRLLRNEAAAEDVVSEVFLDICGKREVRGPLGCLYLDDEHRPFQGAIDVAVARGGRAG